MQLRTCEQQFCQTKFCAVFSFTLLRSPLYCTHFFPFMNVCCDWRIFPCWMLCQFFLAPKNYADSHCSVCIVCCCCRLRPVRQTVAGLKLGPEWHWVAEDQAGSNFWVGFHLLLLLMKLSLLLMRLRIDLICFRFGCWHVFWKMGLAWFYLSTLFFNKLPPVYFVPEVNPVMQIWEWITSKLD